MTTDAITPLRQRMIEDMTARQLGPHSQRSHIYSCKKFAAFLKRSPDTATLEDIRRFQLYLAETGMSICNRNRIMTGLEGESPAASMDKVSSAERVPSFRRVRPAKAAPPRHRLAAPRVVPCSQLVAELPQKVLPPRDVVLALNFFLAGSRQSPPALLFPGWSRPRPPRSDSRSHKKSGTPREPF